ncbi:MAG: pyridoxal-dependent decarboxylase [Terriglobales bacterium]|jgi:aromatic-L-amino-acid decarboxylase
MNTDKKEYIDDFRRAGHQAVEWIAEYLENVDRYPVLPRIRPGDLIAALPKSAPEHGESFAVMLRDFEQQIIPAVTHWNHPRFMAYFACTGSTPAILGDMLAAALNTVGLHWLTSPALAELEQVTLGWLRQWIGLPEEFFGLIYDTASVATLHAIAAARELADPEARVHGSRNNLVLYTSEQSHSSVEKGAIALGVGQKNVRKVQTDSEFRMRPDHLRDLVAADYASGLRPFCVVATVGTTSTTSIDPVEQIALVAEQYNLWLHVDAAYAGPAAILPEHRRILAGAEKAHSLVLNAHKWLFTPTDLSAFYTRRPDILKRAFSLVPEYLKTKSQEDARAVNLMDYSISLGRRFRALKLWFVMRYFGRDGIERLLRSHIAWAQEFASWVDADPKFERVAPAPLSVVCFRYMGTDDENRALLERVNNSGKTFISHTELNGRYVLRVAIGNLATTRDDVQAVWELIRAKV